MTNSANPIDFDPTGFEAFQAEAGGHAMTHQPPHIVLLGEAGQSPVELVGGKAKELGRLMQEGYRVPDGFVITTAVNPDSELPDAVTRALDSSELRAYRSSAIRTLALEGFLNRYNRRRPHRALGNQTPLSRLEALV